MILVIQMSREAMLGIISSGHVSHVIIKPASSAVVAWDCVDADAAHTIANSWRLSWFGWLRLHLKRSRNVCDVRRRHATVNSSSF